MISPNRPAFIPPHGQYQELPSYQKAEVVYDLTFHFCERFLKRGDRTIDQMIQAARSGKRNIAEGSQASGGSKEMEIKLVNVARASLEELMVDYQDFLRVRGGASGLRIPRKPNTSASLATRNPSPMRFTANSAKLAQPK
jgi:four helix bundle protein